MTILADPPETMSSAFVDTVSRVLDADARTALVLAGGAASPFADVVARHPSRVVHLGDRDQMMAAVACGMALTGLRPVVHTAASSPTHRPYEQMALLGQLQAAAVVVGYGASGDEPVPGRGQAAPEDVALVDTLPGWTVHVPGHPTEVRQVLRDALSGDDRVYVRLSARSNAHAHPAGGFHAVRQGTAGVVLAVGPTLDPVLHATAALDVTVLYAATVRPFDHVLLRTAVLAADHPDVVLVEPYLAGTSAHHVGQTLLHVPHRLLTLGVERDAGPYATSHGPGERGIATAIRGFLRSP
jgi:transketolase